MKPDLNFSQELRDFMKKFNQTAVSIAEAVGTSPATITSYAEYTEENPNGSKFWRDAVVQNVSQYMTKVYVKTQEKDDIEKGKELQKTSERQSKALREKTIFKRAKIVHAIMDSDCMDDKEKEEAIVQHMD